MISRIRGVINRVLDEEIRLQVGPIEYQVLVPECVRRQLQLKVGAEVDVPTIQFLEGSQMSNRMIPRLVGFTNEAEMEFFELFCTVEKIGVRKALKALARPVKEIADAIVRQDVKWLTTLPGIGSATAEQIVATLRRKVTRFALMPTPRDDRTAPEAPESATPMDVMAEAYNALLQLGHSPADARDMLDRVASSGKRLSSVEEVLMQIYQRK